MVRPGHRTIVVADDDPALRLLCRVNLELEGYRVVEAGHAAELDGALEAEDVALVLLDVHFGAYDGVEIAQRLRETHPELPIAFFSGTQPELSEDSRRIADAFIPKPFTLENLSETVRRLARA
ncbi:MAG: response regulator [Actinomycetota bacterium]|jgi:two-component system, cell cycle sensor histidine kinase and response regulator CckA|nr:response regulator [Actinomycetota bacterium]